MVWVFGEEYPDQKFVSFAAVYVLADLMSGIVIYSDVRYLFPCVRVLPF